MLKKALGILLVFGILCIALSVAIPTFAEGPVYEMTESYDGAGADTLFGTGDGAPALTMSLLPEEEALYGTGSMAFINNATAGSDWVNALFVKAPTAPTIAATGFFFRMETNAPEGVSMFPIATDNMWSNVWGATFTFVSYDGTVTTATNLVPSANFRGYVFANLHGGKAPAAYEKLGMQMSTWASDGGAAHAHWGLSTTIIDNIGYYATTAGTAEAEYTAIFDAVTAETARNPAILQYIATGNFNDELLGDVQTTMQKVITRPGPTDVFAWSIDNPTIASIDANGVITPKKYGTATVTATLTLPDASQQIKSTLITVVKGSIYFTLEDLVGVANAVSEADGIFGIKPKINAKVIYNGFDNQVVWSVVEGEASVENLSDGVENATALDMHSAYATFENSGTVVLRASLVDAPSVYRDLTFAVGSNPVLLESKIFEAQGLGGEFTVYGYNMLLQAIEDAQALLEEENVEQSVYSEMIDTLQYAMDNVYEEGDTSTPAESETSTDTNPTTSDSVNPMGYAVLLTLALAAMALGRKLVLNRQRR